MPQLNRRAALTAMSSLAGTSLVAAKSITEVMKEPFTLCLNLSTIRGHQLGFEKELQTASKAGFRSVEIWVDSLQTYLKGGGTLASARKLLGDLGLKVENAIGFAPWIVDDATVRAKGLEQMKREMEQLSEVGCMRVAAPPVGATDTPGLDLRKAGERYRAILELSDQTKVVPQLELWGFSQNLNRLSDVLFVAAESGHPSARLLLDVYHLYKGGSALASLPLVGKPSMEIFHLNDYPTSLPPATIVDADRVYPGDGNAPIRDILKIIKNPERPIVLSFEVFNKKYYAQDPLLVAQTSLKKMKEVVKGI